MADKSLTRVLAAAIIVVAAGALRADSLSEAARRAGIEADTAAAQGDQGIALGADSRTGERVVAVFRRAPDGSWSMDRRWLLCGGPQTPSPESRAVSSESPAPPPAAPPAAAAAPVAPSSGPIAMPPPRGLSDGYVRSLQDELRRRARQSAAGDAEEARRNGAYLRDLVQDIGWIDMRRFGVPASCDAARIAIGSGDRELLAAALPKMEKDLKNSEDGRECYEQARKAYQAPKEK